MILLLQTIAVVLLLQFDPVHSDGVSVVSNSDCQPPCIELQCGNSDDTNNWFKNGDSLNLSNDRFSVSDNKLIINNITVDDEGNYSCINTNNPSAVTVDAQLIPLNATINLTVYPGETFVVECGIKFGSVTPKEKEIKINLMSNKTNNISEKKPNNTNWTNPTFTLDYSLYKYDQFFCRVRSSSKFYADNANIRKSQYYGPHYHIKYAPKVSIHEVREGCNVTLVCNTSHPIVNNSNIPVRWLKNGNITNMREYSLTIINASEKDVANYTCIAKVSGVENSASIQLKLAPCFNGAIKLKDCHTLNVTGTYPHHVVIGNMNSSENATFNLTISPDDRYLNISYNVSGLLGPVKHIKLPSFHNCTIEAISFMINISLREKKCEEIERDKNHLVEHFFQKWNHYCSDKVCPDLSYNNSDVELLKCNNSSHEAILSMTISGPNSLHFLKMYCEQLDNGVTTCSAAPSPTETPSPIETPSPTPSLTEMIPHNEAFPLEHVIIAIPLAILLIAFIVLFIIIVIFCLVKVKGRSKLHKISTSNIECQSQRPGIPLDTLGKGNPVTNVLTHTGPTIVHNREQHSHPSSLSSCTIDSSHQSIQSGMTRSTHDRNPCCALPHHHYPPPPPLLGHMIHDDKYEQQSIQSGPTRSTLDRNPRCASPPRHHPPGHVMHDKICKHCYPTVSCHSCNYHQCHPVCYCSGHHPCHKGRSTDFHTFNRSECSRHQGDRYTHPSLINDSQMNHDLESLTTSHGSSDTGHGTQYSQTTFHSQVSEKRSKQVTNNSSGYGGDNYTINPHKRATNKSIEQLKKHGLGFRDVDQPIQTLPHSF